jgi:hypothetical protein
VSPPGAIALRTFVSVALTALISIALLAPTAAACGFEAHEEVAPGVAWGMRCTSPYVQVGEHQIFLLYPVMLAYYTVVNAVWPKVDAVLP